MHNFLKIFSLVIFFSSCEPIEYKIEFCDADQINEYETIKAYKSYQEGLACAKEKGYPIFLFFTGYHVHHVFEDKVLLNRKVQRLLNDDFLPIGLYVDSPKKLPLEEQIWVTQYGKNKQLKTVGNKNTNIQIKRFKHNSQPLFVILNSNGEQIGDTWGWTKDPKFFTDKMEAALKVLKTNN